MRLLWLLATLSVVASVAFAESLSDPIGREMVSDLCASSAVRCFPRQSYHSLQWSAPRSFDDSWLPKRWCRAEVQSLYCNGGDAYESYVAVLNDVNIDQFGVMYDAEREFHDPLLLNLESWEPVEIRQVYPQIIRLEKVAPIFTRFSNNYYHFITESLPRLMVLKPLLDRDPSIKILMHSNRFAIEFLTRLGYADRLVYTGAVDVYQTSMQPLFQAKEVYFASTFSMYKPSITMIQEIRQALGVESAAVRDKIVYVSRDRDSRGFITNESELLEQLRVQFPSLEVVSFSHSTVEEAINLFSQAKLIIGGHGAGLTNMIFAAPHTPVVELLFSTEPISLFWRLASEMSLDYWAVPVPQASWKSPLTAPIAETIDVVHRLLYGVQSHEEIECAPGNFRTNAGECRACSSGFVSQHGEMCQICAAGTYANADQSACVACASGLNTWSFETSTYEPRAVTGVFELLGSSSAASCKLHPSDVHHNDHRSVNAACANPRLFPFDADARTLEITSNDRDIPTSNTPRTIDNTLFLNVANNETHVFEVTNTGSGAIEIGLITSSSALFTVVRDVLAPIQPGATLSFAVQYTPTQLVAYSYVSRDTAVITIAVCTSSVVPDPGRTPSRTVSVAGNSIQVELSINPDFYQMAWTDTLAIPATTGLLANDLSFQGTLRVIDRTVVQALSTTGNSSLAQVKSLNVFPNGTFSLQVVDRFVGTVAFTYLAGNNFANGTARVTVQVSAVSSNITCPESQTLVAPIGLVSTTASWNQPTASFGSVIQQTTGGAPGSDFSYFTSPAVITYTALSSVGVLASTCSFNVSVQVRQPLITCPTAVSTTVLACSAQVTLPVATASGYQVVVSSNHLATDTYPLGETRVRFTATDGVGQQQTCTTKVTVVLKKERFQVNQLAGYRDRDHDGFGAKGSACIVGTRNPSAETAGVILLRENELLSDNNLDCDDTNPFVNPGANELCDGIDNNCNGLIDEGRQCSVAGALGEEPHVAQPIALPTPPPPDRLISLPTQVVTFDKPITVFEFSAAVVSEPMITMALFVAMLVGLVFA